MASIELNRLNIYDRFKTICEMHTAPKQQNEVRCFAVGPDHVINADNLLKGDQQAGLIFSPKYFWSKKWDESNRNVAKVLSDFPMVLLDPGRDAARETSWTETIFEFEIMVVDLKHYDRNNKAGNQTAAREPEDIWTDTKLILLQVLEAFRKTGPNDSTFIVNEVIGADALDIDRDSATWTPAELALYNDFYQCNICGNYPVKFKGQTAVIESDYNKHLAGVQVLFQTWLNTGCIDGDFQLPKC